MSTTKTNFLNRIRSAFRNRLAEALLIPLTRGKRWDHWLAKLPANYDQYKPGSLRSVRRNGILFTLDLSEYMQWVIYFGIVSEPREALYRLVKPGMHVLDVGANIGETTLRFVQLTGPEGRVISFEPFPETFKTLQTHITLNNAGKNVTPVNKALGENAATLSMNTARGNSGGNNIAMAGGKIPVEVIRLDDWMKDHKELMPALIKIDVEGFELKVLRGATETLHHFSPALFVEINPLFLQRADDSADELLTYLAQQGYALEDAETGEPVIPGQPLHKTHFDLIARKR